MYAYIHTYMNTGVYSSPYIVPGLHIGTSINQESRHLNVTHPGRYYERGVAILFETKIDK